MSSVTTETSSGSPNGAGIVRHDQSMEERLERTRGVIGFYKQKVQEAGLSPEMRNEHLCQLARYEAEFARLCSTAQIIVQHRGPQFQDTTYGSAQDMALQQKGHFRIISSQEACAQEAAISSAPVHFAMPGTQTGAGLEDARPLESTLSSSQNGAEMPPQRPASLPPKPTWAQTRSAAEATRSVSVPLEQHSVLAIAPKDAESSLLSGNHRTNGHSFQHSPPSQDVSNTAIDQNQGKAA